VAAGTACKLPAISAAPLPLKNLTE
jgi:hypothetical protein